MSGGLVNLFNMKNISWDCYRFLTALLPLYHIWQQTIPCCLCSPCPFLPFFRHHSFHFPFISPIVHHRLPSNPTPLSLLINGQFKMSVLLLSPHLLFFTFPPASCSSMSSIPTLPSLPISPSLLPSQWATVRHPGPLTVSHEDAVRDADWRTYGNKWWLHLSCRLVSCDLFLWTAWPSYINEVRITFRQQRRIVTEWSQTCWVKKGKKRRDGT